MDFDYPDFDETFMKPKVPEPQEPAPLPNASSQNGRPGNFPSVDRSNKPSFDRSMKPMAAQIEPRSQKSNSLYPDMSTVAKPPSHQNSTNAGSRASPASSFTNAASRPEVHSNKGKQLESSDSSAKLAGLSNDIASDLKELDRQRKVKEEELATMQREYERKLDESKSRLKEEERKLSNLEDIKKKEQTDVADLMR